MRRISVLTWLLWLSAIALSILPLIQTLNDLAAFLAMRLGLDSVLMRLSPIASRFIAALLQYIFRVPVSVYGASIYLEMGGIPREVYLDWNCLGWQGLLLMAIALAIALQGDYTAESKAKTTLLGLEVFIAANAARVLIPCLLLTHFGYRAALLFHNYLATPLILAFISLYWHLSTNFILQPKTEGEGELRIGELLTGRREIGLASMAIILLTVLYSGVGILAAGIDAADGDRTALTFEYAKPDFRYLTHQDWTDLGKKPHRDRWRNTGVPGWYELWEFDLYGPLVEDYEMEGNVVYYVYFYCSKPHDTSYEFRIYDIDPSGGTPPRLVHVDKFMIHLDPISPPAPIKLEGDNVNPYTFSSGHTIRIAIYVYDDAAERRDYFFDYDSVDKHSYADFPGIVIEERVFSSIPLIAIALLLEVRRRDGE